MTERVNAAFFRRWMLAALLLNLLMMLAPSTTRLVLEHRDRKAHSAASESGFLEKKP